MKKQFTAAQIKSMRKDFFNGFTINSLALYHFTSDTVMANIIYKRTYKSVDDGYPTPVPEALKMKKFVRSGIRQLTEKEVIKIRAFREAGIPVALIAEKYEISKTNVYKICNRMLYRDVA